MPLGEQRLGVARAHHARLVDHPALGLAIAPHAVSSKLGVLAEVIASVWVDGVYHQRRHGTLRMSPIAKWQSSPVPAAAAPPRDRLLLALSAFVGTFTVGKRGVRWKNGYYWAATLVPYVGRVVSVRRDEEDRQRR